MRSKKFYITLVLMVMIGLAVFYVIQVGFYPVVIVNSSVISARKFEEAAASAYHYYLQAINTYSKDESEIRKPQVILELRRATLDKMIENILIRNELEVRLGSNLVRLVDRKVDIPEIGASNFSKAVSTLYGITVKDFKKLILIPQAREEILFDKIREDKNDFKEWIKSERQKASVVILASEFKWDGEKVIAK